MQYTEEQTITLRNYVNNLPQNRRSGFVTKYKSLSDDGKVQALNRISSSISQAQIQTQPQTNPWSFSNTPVALGIKAVKDARKQPNVSEAAKSLFGSEFTRRNLSSLGATFKAISPALQAESLISSVAIPIQEAKGKPIKIDTSKTPVIHEAWNQAILPSLDELKQSVGTNAVNYVKNIFEDYRYAAIGTPQETERAVTFGNVMGNYYKSMTGKEAPEWYKAASGLLLLSGLGPLAPEFKTLARIAKKTPGALAKSVKAGGRGVQSTARGVFSIPKEVRGHWRAYRNGQLGKAELIKLLNKQTNGQGKATFKALRDYDKAMQAGIGQTKKSDYAARQLTGGVVDRPSISRPATTKGATDLNTTGARIKLGLDKSPEVIKAEVDARLNTAFKTWKPAPKAPPKVSSKAGTIFKIKPTPPTIKADIKNDPIKAKVKVSLQGPIFGYKSNEADIAIEEAYILNPNISNEQELFDAIVKRNPAIMKNVVAATTLKLEGEPTSKLEDIKQKIVEAKKSPSEKREEDAIVASAPLVDGQVATITKSGKVNKAAVKADKPVVALKLRSGEIVYGAATDHAELARAYGIDLNDVVDGGWITRGRYFTGQSLQGEGEAIPPPIPAEEAKREKAYNKYIDELELEGVQDDVGEPKVGDKITSLKEGELKVISKKGNIITAEGTEFSEEENQYEPYEIDIKNGEWRKYNGKWVLASREVDAPVVQQDKTPSEKRSKQKKVKTKAQEVFSKSKEGGGILPTENSVEFIKQNAGKVCPMAICRHTQRDMIKDLNSKNIETGGFFFDGYTLKDGTFQSTHHAAVVNIGGKAYVVDIPMKYYFDYKEEGKAHIKNNPDVSYKLSRTVEDFQKHYDMTFKDAKLYAETISKTDVSDLKKAQKLFNLQKVDSSTAFQKALDEAVNRPGVVSGLFRRKSGEYYVQTFSSKEGLQNHIKGHKGYQDIVETFNTEKEALDARTKLMKAESEAKAENLQDYQDYIDVISSEVDFTQPEGMSAKEFFKKKKAQPTGQVGAREVEENIFQQAVPLNVDIDSIAKKLRKKYPSPKHRVAVSGRTVSIYKKGILPIYGGPTEAELLLQEGKKGAKKRLTGTGGEGFVPQTAEQMQMLEDMYKREAVASQLKKDQVFEAQESEARMKKAQGFEKRITDIINKHNSRTPVEPLPKDLQLDRKENNFVANHVYIPLDVSGINNIIEKASIPLKKDITVLNAEQADALAEPIYAVVDKTVLGNRLLPGDEKAQGELSMNEITAFHLSTEDGAVKMKDTRTSKRFGDFLYNTRKSEKPVYIIGEAEGYVNIDIEIQRAQQRAAEQGKSTDIIEEYKKFLIVQDLFQQLKTGLPLEYAAWEATAKHFIIDKEGEIQGFGPEQLLDWMRRNMPELVKKYPGLNRITYGATDKVSIKQLQDLISAMRAWKASGELRDPKIVNAIKHTYKVDFTLPKSDTELSELADKFLKVGKIKPTFEFGAVQEPRMLGILSEIKMLRAFAREWVKVNSLEKMNILLMKGIGKVDDKGEFLSGSQVLRDILTNFKDEGIVSRGALRHLMQKRDMPRGHIERLYLNRRALEEDILDKIARLQRTLINMDKAPEAMTPGDIFQEKVRQQTAEARAKAPKEQEVAKLETDTRLKEQQREASVAAKVSDWVEDTVFVNAAWKEAHVINSDEGVQWVRDWAETSKYNFISSKRGIGRWIKRVPKQLNPMYLEGLKATKINLREIKDEEIDRVDGEGDVKDTELENDTSSELLKLRMSLFGADIAYVASKKLVQATKELAAELRTLVAGNDTTLLRDTMGQEILRAGRRREGVKNLGDIRFDKVQKEWTENWYKIIGIPLKGRRLTPGEVYNPLKQEGLLTKSPAERKEMQERIDESFKLVSFSVEEMGYKFDIANPTFKSKPIFSEILFRKYGKRALEQVVYLRHLSDQLSDAANLATGIDRSKVLVDAPGSYFKRIVRALPGASKEKVIEWQKELDAMYHHHHLSSKQRDFKGRSEESLKRLAPDYIEYLKQYDLTLDTDPIVALAGQFNEVYTILANRQFLKDVMAVGGWRGLPAIMREGKQYTDANGQTYALTDPYISNRWGRTTEPTYLRALGLKDGEIIYITEALKNYIDATVDWEVGGVAGKVARGYLGLKTQVKYILLANVAIFGGNFVAENMIEMQLKQIFDPKVLASIGKFSNEPTYNQKMEEEAALAGLNGINSKRIAQVMRDSIDKQDNVIKSVGLESIGAIFKDLFVSKVGTNTWMWDVLVPRLTMYAWINKRQQMYDQLYKADKNLTPEDAWKRAGETAAALINRTSGLLSDTDFGTKAGRNFLKFIFLSDSYRMAAYSHISTSLGWSGKSPVFKGGKLSMGGPSPKLGLGLGAFTPAERKIIAKHMRSHLFIKMLGMYLVANHIMQMLIDRHSIFDNIQEFGWKGAFHVIDRNSADGRNIGYRFNIFRTMYTLASTLFEPIETTKSGLDPTGTLIVENIIGLDFYTGDEIGYRGAGSGFEKMWSHIEHTFHGVNPAGRVFGDKYSRYKKRLEKTITGTGFLFSQSLINNTKENLFDFKEKATAEDKVRKKKLNRLYDVMKFYPTKKNQGNFFKYAFSKVYVSDDPSQQEQALEQYLLSRNRKTSEIVLLKNIYNTYKNKYPEELVDLLRPYIKGTE